MRTVARFFRANPPKKKQKNEKRYIGLRGIELPKVFKR